MAVDDGTRTLTYRQLEERSGRLANALLALGAGPDRPAAILLPNDFHFVEIDAACMRAGITRVGISSRLSADECQFIVAHSRASVLITSPTLLAPLDPGALDGLTAILLVDGPAVSQDRRRHYESTLSQAHSAFSAPPVPPDHPAYILYTSGTTGRPKGATHTHGGRVAALNNMLASEIVADGTAAMVHGAPLTHGSGSKVLTFLALGARNIILPRFEPDLFADAIAQRGGTHSFMVPTMLQMLLEGGSAVVAAVRRMRQITFGGAPITNAVFARALDGFGPILTQIYGTSEAPHPVTVLRPDDYVGAADPSALAETAGRPSLASEVRIVDGDDRPLAIDAEGELLVRGSYVMRGYWQDAEATAAAFDSEGWYRTGDVAVMDAAGFVRFKDRKHELIISGGLNIYPSEVERVLAAHPNVREVAVVGYPDDRWGESVMACVVPRVPDQADAEALIAWIEGRIAGYKKPRKVLFLDDLPKGSTNKVLKRVLRESLWQGRERRIH